MKSELKKSTRKNKYSSLRVQTLNTLPSRTQQQFKNEVNVNNIMKKYLKTGVITHINTKKGIHTEQLVPDTYTSTTYQEAMNIIATSNSQFEELPSELRKKFANDPSKFLEFLHDPKNYEEAVKLRLFKPDPNLNQTKQPIAPPLNDETKNDESTTPSSKKKS